MKRRTFLSAGIASGLAMCPLCLGAAGALASGGQRTTWSYEGANGPSQWGSLTPEYRVCDLGLQQSPIDLAAAVPARTGSIYLHWPSLAVEIANNGHTIQASCQAGGHVTLDGHRFDLIQFHFHHPSEHLVDGMTHAMEVHFVHSDGEGHLAVLGVFLTAGRENAALAPIWQVMPRTAGEVAPQPITMMPADLLPASRDAFRYYGSLTTPPCSERVDWVVFAEPVSLSSEQIGQFAALFPNNARPVQPLNRRFLLRSGAIDG